MCLVLADQCVADSANASGVASSRIFCNHKFQYRLHNTSPPVSTLSQITPVHAIPATGWKVSGMNPGGARFSAPVQTGPEAPPHRTPAPCTMDIRSLSRRQRTARGVGYPPFLTQVKERVQLYSTPPLSLHNLL